MNIRKELNKIFDTINNLIINDNFNEIDNILQNIDVDNTALTLLIGYLSITYQAKHLLKNRYLLFKKINDKLIKNDESN